MSEPTSTLPPESKLPVATITQRLGQRGTRQIQIPSPVAAAVPAANGGGPHSLEGALLTPNACALCKSLETAQTLPPIPVLTDFPRVPFITKKSKVPILPVPMVEMDFNGRVGE